MGQPNREKIIGLKRALSSDVLAMAVMEIGEHCECDTSCSILQCDSERKCDSEIRLVNKTKEILGMVGLGKLFLFFFSIFNC